MDFVVVPAGTTPDQAQLIRGSDHDLELATADPFITVMGQASQARSAPGLQQDAHWFQGFGMSSMSSGICGAIPAAD